MSDSRAFGYIFGSPDTGHRFFGIKTDKTASQVKSIIFSNTITNATPRRFVNYFFNCPSLGGNFHEGFISSCVRIEKERN